MIMNIITLIGVIFTVICGWIAWKESIKKQELEALGDSISAEEYLSKCYKNDSISTWCKDNLAQKFTKILKMDHILNNRLIELHENNLIEYNDLIKNYRYGHPQIRYIRSNYVNFIRDIQFLPYVKSNYSSEKIFLSFMLFLGFFPICISIYEISQFSLKNKDINFLNLFSLSTLFVQGLITIFVSMYFNRIVENANLFVTKIHEAEVKFLQLKNIHQVKKNF